MKSIALAALALLTSVPASAETLTCYSTYGRNPNAAPALTAKIISDSRLEDVTLAKWMKTPATRLKDYRALKGELNENNRSPYKGAVDYSPPNGDTFYLPADLSARNLKKTLTTPAARGFGKGENGVIIGNWKDGSGDGAGSHYSYRLRCGSDKK